MMRREDFFAVYALYLRLEKCIYNPGDPKNQRILQVLYSQVESILEISKRNLNDEVFSLSEYCENLDRLVSQIEDGVQWPLDDVRDVIKGIHSFLEYLENFLKYAKGEYCEEPESLDSEIEDGPLDHVEDVIEEIDHSFIPRLKILEEGFVDVLYDSFSDHEKVEEQSDAVSSQIIGLSDVYQSLKLSLMSDVIITSLVGMPGIGKTTLAKKVFHDPTIVEHFDHCVWVRVGKRCRFKDIPRRILAEMDPGVVHVDAADDKLKLKERLESERCLVVLDDVWDTYMAFFLDPTLPKPFENYHHFLSSESGSRVLVISRMYQYMVDLKQHRPPFIVIRMRLMDKEESWTLLREKLFSQGLCPRELEKVGKKIAENCEGLPLTILAVAGLLSQREKTLELWNEVAAKKNHRVFKDAYDRISKVLFPSYTYLPRTLQTCFLFMGLFRQNYKIPRTKLINLWHADGFDELVIVLDLDIYANGYLEELVENNLVMVYQKSSYNYDHYIKTCGLHSSLWHLSNKIAREANFSVVLNNLTDCLDNAIEDHRRLSFHNNVLFGIKDVHESVENKCASIARSLLCYGPYHQYQVPLCYRLDLLRELDAVSIRFYEFPMEVLQLVELRYLTLTANGKIPPSISQLSKLQFLTVDRHLNVKFCNGPSYLPVEIWELEELKHLEVTGSDLPDPSGNYLSNLHTLLNVSDSSCTEVVLSAIPSLEELGIRIELASSEDGKLLNSFYFISHHLKHLKSLKYVIVNSGVARPIIPFSVNKYLSKLSLSGLGYPWKEMGKINSLNSLNVLKLKNHAFLGPEWEVEDSGLTSLCTLVIEDADIVEWKIGSLGKFTRLEHLRMKHVRRIELVDCNPLCVYEMKKAVQERSPNCVVDVQFSWEEH